MTTWKYVINEAKAYALIVEDEDGSTVAELHRLPGGKDFEAVVRTMTVAPKLLAALEEVIIPLILLGDYIGNEWEGKTGIPAFDRCAIIGRVRDAIASANSEQPVAKWDESLPEKLAEAREKA
jgi:hypothetical protein